MNPVRSEKGVALIVVLLLLAVMAGLTAGLSLNSQTEIAMAHNETYYAGARAAAEAGLNRATELIQDPAYTAINLITTKAVPLIGNGPFNLTSEYSYSFEILDDDDPALYNGVALSGPRTDPTKQLFAMNENGDPNDDDNARMILRATATGPHGTSVTIGRVLEQVSIPALPTVTTINPAILVNGNLDLNGNSLVVNGTQGNVHANGDITGGPATGITGNVTATGHIDDSIDPGGLKAGGMPPIPVPAIRAQDYLGLANYKLKSTGVIQVLSGGVFVNCTGSGALACPTGWSFSGGQWEAHGSMPVAPAPNKATYYAETSVDIQGTGKSTGFTEISVISEGSISVTGNGKFKPGNTSKIQFVANGDFNLGGTADADDPIDMDGQILVAEQMKIYGNSEFQGRVMVENRDSTANSCTVANVPGCRKGTGLFSTNNLSGNMTVTYNGSLGGITVEIPGGPDSYTRTISGWMEQQ